MPQNPVKSTLFVSQLVAGAGITLTPAYGTGIVEVAATDGEYDPAAVDITGGTVDGVVVGGVTPEAGKFTTLDAASIGTVEPPLTTVAALHVDTGMKTVAAVAGAAVLNKMAGVVTSEALTTAGLASYTLTLTDSDIAATDQVMVSVGNGTNTQGTVALGTVNPEAGSVVIVVHNLHATQALNGTLTISFVVFKN
jgi:hypothetical protein